MNYYKLLPKIKTRNTVSGELDYTSSLKFVFPILEPYKTRNKHIPDSLSKPHLKLPFGLLKFAESGENIYQIKNNEPVDVITNKDYKDWIGTTFLIRIDNSRACQGYYYISFDLLEILTEQNI